MLKSLKNIREKDGVSLQFGVAVSFITLITACLPLFTVNCIQGHDIDYHLLRIEALKTGILNGAPFLRVNMLFFGGEGYASSLFYPDFLLYIPASLRALGVGINLSYHIFVAFCLIAAFAVMYFSVLYISENRAAALISAIVYTLCQYHIDDIYTRSAVGEFTAFIFLPLIAAGLIDLTERDFKKPGLLIAGMAGTLLCHTLSTVFALIFCLIFAAVKYRVFVKDPLRILKLMAAAIFTVTITAFYWLPVMEQMSCMEFKYADSVFDLGYEKLLMRQIFENSAGRMGIAVFILLLSSLLILHLHDDLVKTADIHAVIGMIFTLCTTGIFPWKRMERFLYSVQFPWRLFIMSSLLFAIAIGIYMVRIPTLRGRAAVVITLSIMIVSAVLNINRTDEGYYSYSDDYYDEVRYTKTVIGGEWLPKAVTEREKLGNKANTAFDDKGEALPAERMGRSVTVSGINSAYVDVPFIYYPGYKALDASGMELSLSGAGMNGRVRVETPGIDTIRVFYGGTLLQRIADIISILAAILAAALLLLRKKK